MAEVRYIHAADFHLDASFVGLKREMAQGAHLTNLLRQATFRALENLVRLCEETKPDFVVLAGDIYNQEERSIRAQLELREACQRLGKMGIRVFIVHGNHDPLSSRLNQISWPENVHIFGSSPESVAVEKNGETLALAHGVSHADSKVGENLAKLLYRDEDSDCFQLGILHCNVNGSVPDKYAPCSLEDLRAANMDAWALGHAHAANVLCRQPLVAYSGCAQGLHINEDGPRGCYVVSAERDKDVWRCKTEFRQLGPVRWEKLTLDLSGVETMNDLEQMLNEQIENYRSSCSDVDQGVIFRIRLEGRTPLDEVLRKEDPDASAFPSLGQYTYGQPSIWIKDFEIVTRPMRGEEEYLRRDDILGETCRVARDLAGNESELEKWAHSVLKPLFGNAHLKKILDYPESGQIGDLLDDAESICQDMLEKR